MTPSPASLGPSRSVVIAAGADALLAAARAEVEVLSASVMQARSELHTLESVVPPPGSALPEGLLAQLESTIGQWGREASGGRQRSISEAQEAAAARLRQADAEADAILAGAHAPVASHPTSVAPQPAPSAPEPSPPEPATPAPIVLVVDGGPDPTLEDVSLVPADVAPAPVSPTPAPSRNGRNNPFVPYVVAANEPRVPAPSVAPPAEAAPVALAPAEELLTAPVPEPAVDTAARAPARRHLHLDTWVPIGAVLFVLVVVATWLR